LEVKWPFFLANWLWEILIYWVGNLGKPLDLGDFGLGPKGRFHFKAGTQVWECLDFTQGKGIFPTVLPRKVFLL